MKLRPSQVFENYAVIAESQGILSKPGEELKSLASEDGRYGSDDLSTIEVMYGVKPNGKDEKDIVDQAHPESVIIAPSYDKLNGLVENQKEQHNIMVGIINKPHQAKLTQHKYAAQALSQELVSLGFSLDNQDETELCTLADECLRNFTKTAIWWAAVPWVAGGLVALYTAISQNVNMSQGVLQDAEKAMVEIQEAIGDYPQLSSELSFLLTLIGKIQAHAGKTFQVMSSLVRNAPGGIKHPEKIANYAKSLVDHGDDKKMLQALETYLDEVEELIEIIPGHIANLKLRLKELEPAHSDLLEPLYRAYRYVVPTDVEDAWEALDTLSKSLRAEPVRVQGLINKIKQLQSTVGEIPNSQPQEERQVEEEDKKAIPVSSPKEMSDEPNEIEQLTRQLLNV